MKFDFNSIYKQSDKVIEIRKERVRVPFHLVEFKSKEEMQAYCQIEDEISNAKVKIRSEIRRATAIAWLMDQNAPKDVRQCECGSDTIGSSSHSSWCPIFTSEFSRKKNSNPEYVSTK